MYLRWKKSAILTRSYFNVSELKLKLECSVFKQCILHLYKHGKKGFLQQLLFTWSLKVDNVGFSSEIWVSSLGKLACCPQPITAHRWGWDIIKCIQEEATRMADTKKRQKFAKEHLNKSCGLINFFQWFNLRRWENRSTRKKNKVCRKNTDGSRSGSLLSYSKTTT